MKIYEANSLCTQFHIDPTQDFFILSSSEVEQVLEAADFVKYRKPKNANGTRGRYFYAALQRALKPRAWSGFVNPYLWRKYNEHR